MKTIFDFNLPGDHFSSTFHFAYFMFHSYLILSVIFGKFIHGERSCFCYCCSPRPCTLKMQDQWIQIDKCDQCNQACRTQYSACQSTIKTGKVFELCSTNADKHRRLEQWVNGLITFADAVFEIKNNSKLVQSQLKTLRDFYEWNMKKDSVHIDQV